MLNDDFIVAHGNALDHQPHYLLLQLEGWLLQLGADPFTKGCDRFSQGRPLLGLGNLYPHDLLPLLELLLRLP